MKGTQGMERIDAPSAKWFQLAFGIVCMASVANLQYGWTLFVDPIDAQFHWGRPAIQLAFTLFVATETWLVPVEAWFVDRYGPQAVVFFGGIMVALSWTIDANATSIFALYAAAVIGGIGAGSVYGTCVGNALKWFPHKRGLAAGATAAGFGAGAAITVFPIAKMIASSGYQQAFLYFGIGQGLIVIVMSFLLRKPVSAGAVGRKRLSLPQTTIDRTPMETVRTPVFWLMYVMFVMVAAGGLMAAAQIAPVAKDFKVAAVPMSLFGMQMAALTFAISLDRIFDGFGRPIFGYVSDRIGRENTMCIAFTTAAVAIGVLVMFGTNPLIFVLSTAVFFGVFGEIYSLFPATSGDTFGSKYATTNNGLLYTAKGTAAFLVPIASVVSAAYGWSAVFAVMVVLNLTAAGLAIFVLKPMRLKYILGAVPAGSSEKTVESGGGIVRERA
jgi:OFA family oxalate/formate antiporter-like MFS transporter